MSRALYLYGFVPRGAAPPPADLRGVGGGRPELLDVGEVTAVVSPVPAEEFAPDVVQERVHDLAWVGEQGALHERVVTWFVDHGGILPVRLLTLYSGPEALRDSLRDRHANIAERLERLRGLREWDLKVSYDGDVLRKRLGEVSEAVAALEREVLQAAPGRRYLLERKRDQLAKEELARAARRLAEDVLEELLPFSADARRLPLPRDKGDFRVVVNAALLVSADMEERARARAEEERERLREIGLDVRFTGPWAPYRFLAEEDDEGRGGGDGVEA